MKYHIFMSVNNSIHLETDEYDASTDEGGDTDDEIERYEPFGCKENVRHIHSSETLVIFLMNISFLLSFRVKASEKCEPVDPYDVPTDEEDNR